MWRLIPSTVSGYWLLAAVLAWAILLGVLARYIWKIAKRRVADRRTLVRRLADIQAVIADEDALSPTELGIAKLLEEMGQALTSSWFTRLVGMRRSVVELRRLLKAAIAARKEDHPGSFNFRMMLQYKLKKPAVRLWLGLISCALVDSLLRDVLDWARRRENDVDSEMSSMHTSTQQ